MYEVFLYFCKLLIHPVGAANSYTIQHTINYNKIKHHNMDKTVFDLISEERARQMRGIELIASENFVSDQVMQTMGSVLTNKYAEGYPGKRYYGGCQVVDKVEELAIERICKLFDAEYANVQPHSGAQANAAVFLACLELGDTFMGLNLDHGGHLSHGSAVNTSGINYNPVGYNLNKATGRVDYDEMERLAMEHKPKLIVGGGSAYSREWDYRRMREIADSVGAILMIDMAHPAGLIAAGLLENPVKYAHIVTSTTHKTLRGPRGGIILMGKDFPNPWGKTTPKGEIKMMSALLNSAVFPGTQGGPLEHVIAAKAVAFGEALTPKFREYATQVKKNAAVLAEELQKRGFYIVSGGTDNQLAIGLDLVNNTQSIAAIVLAAASDQAQTHSQSQHQCKQFLHSFHPPVWLGQTFVPCVSYILLVFPADCKDNLFRNILQNVGFFARYAFSVRYGRTLPRNSVTLAK